MLSNLKEWCFPNAAVRIDYGPCRLNNFCLQLFLDGLDGRATACFYGRPCD